MSKKSFMPRNDDDIRAMLATFDSNISSNGAALAAKYNVTQEERLRVTRALLVWQWIVGALEAIRNAAASMTSTRDSMLTGAPSTPIALPTGPVFSPTPTIQTPEGSVAALLEPGFFTFFSSLVSRIKGDVRYDESDGQLLGIEGAEVPPPDPKTVPVLLADFFGNGQPELTCKKGPFQGYDVWLRRPGQELKHIGFSLARNFKVEEPRPAPGTAEIWTFEVQYRYQNASFGQKSQPLSLTVRG